MEFKSLVHFLERFDTEQSCYGFFENLRYKNGVYCSHCQRMDKICQVKSNTAKSVYKCGYCNRRFNVLIGTMFESTKLPLQTWFVCLYLIATSKKGISSVQLANQAGITQKTAWTVLHKIRNSFSSLSHLFGEIEMDESYIGGKEKNKHQDKKTDNTQGRSTKTKQPVIGAVERNGNIIAIASDKATQTEINNLAEKHIHPGSVIYTDEYKGYRNLPGKYIHRIVNHGIKQFVNGRIHTNTIESFWSIFKRGYVGIYHYMSKKHLQKYLNEYIFRHNNDNPLSHYLVCALNQTVKLPYRLLIRE